MMVSMDSSSAAVLFDFVSRGAGGDGGDIVTVGIAGFAVASHVGGSMALFLLAVVLLPCC